MYVVWKSCLLICLLINPCPVFTGSVLPGGLVREELRECLREAGALQEALQLGVGLGLRASWGEHPANVPPFRMDQRQKGNNATGEINTRISKPNYMY